MSTIIKGALARLNEAGRKYTEAVTEENSARAEYVRLRLLALAEKHPRIEGFDLELSWEYDDEGGYYATVIVSTDPPWDFAQAEDVVSELEDELEDDLIEVGNELNEGSLAQFQALAPPGFSDTTSFTVEQLRGVTF